MEWLILLGVVVGLVAFVVVLGVQFGKLMEDLHKTRKQQADRLQFEKHVLAVTGRYDDNTRILNELIQRIDGGDFSFLKNQENEERIKSSVIRIIDFYDAKPKEWFERRYGSCISDSELDKLQKMRDSLVSDNFLYGVSKDIGNSLRKVREFFEAEERIAAKSELEDIARSVADLERVNQDKEKDASTQLKRFRASVSINVLFGIITILAAIDQLFNIKSVLRLGG